MFSYIKGTLAETSLDHIVVETGGIGYEISLSTQSLEELPPVGEDVKIYTHLYIREDLMTLFGFTDRQEQELFLLLISVNGIGPKGALAILSTLSVENLRFAILAGDAKTIAKAPGVGQKTAQRIVLDLKDKISFEDTLDQALTKDIDSAGPEPGVKNDAILALTALGYSQTESMQAVSKVAISEDMDVEDVLKLALKHLSLF